MADAWLTNGGWLVDGWLLFGLMKRIVQLYFDFLGQYLTGNNGSFQDFFWKVIVEIGLRGNWM